MLTALKKGSLYNAAMLGFQLLAVWGGLSFRTQGSLQNGKFPVKEEARNWPVICHIDRASGTIHVRIIS